MASEVDVANGALLKLGADNIVSLDDGSPAARYISRAWDRARRDELCRYPWTFAIGRRLLPAEADVPDFGWSYQYVIPAECLRLVRVGRDGWLEDRGTTFELEGGRILTNEAAPLPVRFVADVPNAGSWPPEFVEAMACRLAMELAEKITAINSKVESAKAWYLEAIGQARRNNAIQKRPIRAGGTEPWTVARGIGRGRWHSDGWS